MTQEQIDAGLAKLCIPSDLVNRAADACDEVGGLTYIYHDEYHGWIFVAYERNDLPANGFRVSPWGIDERDLTEALDRVADLEAA